MSVGVGRGHTVANGDALGEAVSLGDRPAPDGGAVVGGTTGVIGLVGVGITAVQQTSGTIMNNASQDLDIDVDRLGASDHIAGGVLVPRGDLGVLGLRVSDAPRQDGQ